jgi:hypothetical protein
MNNNYSFIHLKLLIDNVITYATLCAHFFSYILLQYTQTIYDVLKRYDPMKAICSNDRRSKIDNICQRRFHIAYVM